MLPFIKSADVNRDGEIWHLRAEGGSGEYEWGIENSAVAEVSGMGVLRSKDIGLTKVVVYDRNNKNNKAELAVEVTPVHTLTWLEHHIEIPKNEIGTISVIALDSQGRKFTNCTAVRPRFELKSEGII